MKRPGILSEFIYSIHSIRRGPGVAYRLLSATLIAAHISMYVLPLGVLRADPVPVPALKTPKFNSGDMQPYFNKAIGSENASFWDAIVSQGLQLIEASWEKAAEVMITDELNKVTQSDAYNGTDNYQDYVKKSLEIQKEAARTDWETAAHAEIEVQRDEYLASLAQEQLAAEQKATKKSANTGEAVVDTARPSEQAATGLEAFQNAQTQVTSAEQAWLNNFRGRLTQGLNDYDSSLNQLNFNYQTRMSALSEADQQWQTNRGVIQAYENQVRTAIGDNLTHMSSNLVNNGMFHNEDGSLNDSGKQLQDLIQKVQAQLDQRAPLSTIAGTMNSFLDAQLQFAVATQAEYQKNISGTEAGTGAGGKAIRAYNGQGANALSDEGVKALQNYLSTGDQTQLAQYVQSTKLAGSTRQITGINYDGTDLIGESKDTYNDYDTNDLTCWGVNLFRQCWFVSHHHHDLTNPGVYKWGSLKSSAPLQINYGQQGTDSGCSKYETTYQWGYDPNTGVYGQIPTTTCTQSYSNPITTAGQTYNNALYYLRPNGANLCRQLTGTREVTTGYGEYATTTTESYTYDDPTCSMHNVGDAIAQENVGLYVSYNWHDDVAEKNANTWQGYVDNLSPFMKDWRDMVMPAITTWEKQVSDYDQAYSDWKTQADQQRAQITDAYTSSREELTQSRSAWASSMVQEKRRGDARWSGVHDLLATQEQKWDQMQSYNAAEREAAGSELASMLNTATNSAMNEVYSGATRLPDPGSMLASFNAKVPELKDSFLSKSMENLPDLSKIGGIAEAFGQSLRGIENSAVAHAQQEQISALRKKQIENMKATLNSLDHLCDGQSNCDENAKLIEAGKNMGFQGSEADILAGMKKMQSDNRFTIEENEDGSLTVSRRIPDGTVIRKGGDGTNPDDYNPGLSAQMFKIPPPASVEMASGGGLFDSWDMNSVMNQFSQNEEQSSNQGQSQLQIAVAGAMQDAAAAQAAGERLYENQRQIAIDREIAHQAQMAMIQSIAQSMLGGMNLGQAIKSYAQGQVQSKIAQAIGEATGIDVSFLSALVGAKMSGLGNSAALKSAIKSYSEDKMWDAAGEASGNPDLVKALRQMIGIKAAHKAAVKKNQEQNIKIATTVAAVAATIATGGAAAPLMSMALTAGITAAGNAVVGYMEGGLTGAVVSGASAVASAYATAGLGAYATGLGVNIGVTYSYENGFGGSVGLSYAGAGGLGGGASLNFQEGKGFTGGGVNVGYKTGGTTSSQGLNLGMNFDKNGGFQGGALTYSNSSGSNNQTGTFKGGLSFDKSGLTGVNATYTNTTSMGGFSSGTTGGLGYNKNGTTDVIAGATVSASNPNGTGWNSAGTDMTSKFNFDSSGKFNGITQNIGLSLGYQTTGGLIKKLESQKEAIQNNDKLTPAQKEAALAQVDADIANAADQQRRTEGAGVATVYEVTRREHVEHEQSTGEEKPDPLGGKPLGNGEAAYLARNMANQLGVPVEGDGVVYNQVLAKLNDITGGKEATAAQIEQAAREVAADRGAPGADGDVNWDTAKQNAAYVQGVDVQRYNQAQQEAQAARQQASNSPAGLALLGQERPMPLLPSLPIQRLMDFANCSLQAVGVENRFFVALEGAAQGAVMGPSEGILVVGGKASVMSAYFGNCGNSNGETAAILAGATGGEYLITSGDRIGDNSTPFMAGMLASIGLNGVIGYGKGGSDGLAGPSNEVDAAYPGLGSGGISWSSLPPGQTLLSDGQRGYAAISYGKLGEGVGLAAGRHTVQPIYQYYQDGTVVGPKPFYTEWKGNFSFIPE